MTTTPGPLIPDFLILGAQKCGTSSLAMALRSHPDIFIPALKEAQHYGFVPDEQVGGDSYREFFRGRGGERLIGEATPEYLYLPKSQQQITANLPEVKAIVLLRNPVDRAYSAYKHGRSFGAFRSSFEQALAQEQGRVSKGDWGFAPLTARGLYADQLNRYVEGGLDRSRLQVVLLEDLVAEPESSLATIQNFLGVEVLLTEMPFTNRAKSSVLPFPIRRLLARFRRRSVLANRALAKSFRPAAPEPMKPETRAKLVEMFIEPNEELARLIGRDLSSWNR